MIKNLGIPFRPFLEEKKPRISIPNRFWKLKKNSEFCSEPIFGTENARKSVPNHFWEQKKLVKIPLLLAAL
jgi:hypothetical protein